MATMKHEILSVSKYVVRYQKYVHMKACLAWIYIYIYISTALAKVNMTLIPVGGKAKRTQVKGYHPISLLFFMQKIMQKWVASHIRDKSLALCPHTSIPICLKTSQVHRNSNLSHDYTYIGSSGKQLHLRFTK